MLVLRKLVEQAVVQQLLMAGLVGPQQALLALRGLQIHFGRLLGLQALVAGVAAATLLVLVVPAVMVEPLAALVVEAVVEQVVAASAVLVRPAL